MAHPWSGADARPESWSGTVLPGGATTYYRLHRLFQRGAMTRQAVDTLLAEENSNEPLSPNDVDAIMGMLDTRFGDAEVWAPGLIVEVEPSPLEERAAARAAMDEMGVPELSVARRKKDVPVCLRCQSFGHTAAHCDQAAEEQQHNASA